MKKLLILIFSLLFVFPYGVVASATQEDPVVKTINGYYDIEEPDFATDIALLVNADTDTVIYSKNANQITAPASLTKIVTALVVLGKCKNLQTQVTCSEKALNSLLGTDSSIVGLKAGEVTTVEMLLYCLFLPSANDAAAVLAEHFGKGRSEAGFVAEMNEYVKKLGCKNTHFANPHGLDDMEVEGFASDTQNRTTAYDMYKIAKKALSNDIIRKISSKYGKTMPPTNKHKERYLYTTNQLLNSYSYYFYEGTVGLKTGTTDKAGSCLIAGATKDGYTYIAVSMKGVDNYYAAGEGRNTAFLMCRYMLKWAFSNMKMKLLADSSYNVGEATVKFGRGSDYVGLIPEKNVSCIVHKDIEFDDLQIDYGKGFPKEVDAPVKQGEPVGKVALSYNGVKVGEITLVAQQTVKKNYLWAMFSWLEKLVSSKLFVAIFIITTIALVAYLVLTKNDRRRRKRRKSRVDVVKDYSKLAK